LRMIGSESFYCRFYCFSCGREYSFTDGIPCLMEPPSAKREYGFEIDRYNRIAAKLPSDYKGLDESKPEARTKIVKELIGDAELYLNIGAGFGQLEQSMPDKNKVCLDQSIGFLRMLQRKDIPNTFLVNGFAERMPFKSNVFPCVVSDSVWTVAVDQPEYFLENVRVLRAGGTLVSAVNYKWNYPRKPQSFRVDDPSLLLHYLDENGVKAEAKYYDLSCGEATTYEKGDYQVIYGHKKSDS